MKKLGSQVEYDFGLAEFSPEQAKEDYKALKKGRLEDIKLPLRSLKKFNPKKFQTSYRNMGGEK